jgi:multiple sugar transport system ATP-binding protein
MAEVRYENATRVYPGAERPAVDALSLAIRDGEFVVMAGPPGCGTTTALRMLAGLEELDEGSILIGGEDMAGVPSRERDVAMVFQNYALYPSKTVGENMGFALRMRGIGEEEAGRRVREAARLLDLEPLLDRTPRNLSGGQRQRVALGRAIVREPKVFCMDEPLSNLDAAVRAATQAQISELQRRLRVTTVYVTHDQAEAMTMGDRVAVLRDGRLQQFAAPAELYERPANVFVASFIGSPAMNLFDAAVEQDGISLAGASLPLRRAQRQALQGHVEVVAGIRPEHLSATPGPGQGELVLKVALVEDVGGDGLIYGQVAGDPGSNVIVRSGPVRPQPGEVIRVGADPARLHLFDAASGQRLGDG